MHSLQEGHAGKYTKKKKDKQSYQIKLSALNMDMVAYPQYMS